MTAQSFKIGVLASHTGTTLQAVMDACQSGRIPGEVALVISNNSGSGALARAKQAGIAVLHCSGRTHPDPDRLDGAICGALQQSQVNVVLLAGYMKKLGPKTLDTFAGRIINTHPALLPKFGGKGMYGEHVHRAVLAAKETESGATVHLVDADYDTGASIRQVRVPVKPDDTVATLATRVQAGERELLVDVLRDIAQGKIQLG